MGGLMQVWEDGGDGGADAGGRHLGFLLTLLRSRTPNLPRASTHWDVAAQVPPMYSAIKVQGQKLYDMAREGQVIER